MGEICKVLLPIPEEVYFGNQNSSIAICTLSSIDLLQKLSNSGLLEKVAIIGRLLSENKGIDSIIQYVTENKNIQTIVLCGKDVTGHKAGQSLLALHKNGIDEDGRIINSTSPDPVLKVTRTQVEYFQTKIQLINLINETNSSTIQKLIESKN